MTIIIILQHWHVRHIIPGYRHTPDAVYPATFLDDTCMYAFKYIHVFYPRATWTRALKERILPIWLLKSTDSTDPANEQSMGSFSSFTWPIWSPQTTPSPHVFVLRLNQWERDRNTTRGQLAEGRRHFKSTTCWKTASEQTHAICEKRYNYSGSKERVGIKGGSKKNPLCSIVLFAFSNHRSSSSWHLCQERTPRLCELTHRGRRIHRCRKVKESSCDTRGRKMKKNAINPELIIANERDIVYKVWTFHIQNRKSIETRLFDHTQVWQCAPGTFFFVLFVSSLTAEGRISCWHSQITLSGVYCKRLQPRTQLKTVRGVSLPWCFIRKPIQDELLLQSARTLWRARSR